MRLYRIIAFVGRWSMLDIFMISILVSLVNLGGVAQVIAGSASMPVTSVLTLTGVALTGWSMIPSADPKRRTRAVAMCSEGYRDD